MHKWINTLAQLPRAINTVWSLIKAGIILTGILAFTVLCFVN